MGAPAPPGDGGHDAPWLRAYPAGVPSTYPYPDVHVARLLDDAAQDFPDTVAIEYRRYRLTYRKLADHADRFATALQDLGVGPGARVAVLLPNCPQLVITMFATWRVGAELVLLEPGDAGAMVDADPAVVVVLDDWYARRVAPHRDALDGQVVVTGIGDYLPFPDNVLLPVRRLVRRRPVRIPATERVLSFADLVRRNVPVTTAPPPASVVALPSPLGGVRQRQLVINCFQLRLWLPDVMAGDERVLLGVPLSSPWGVLWVLTSVLAAATMTLVDDRRAAVRQRIVVRARPTILPLDDDLIDVVLRPTRLRSMLPSVRIAVSCDPLPAARRRELEDVTDKGRIRRAWGVGGLVTHADPIYGRYVEGTVGLPLPDTAAAVADPERPDAAAPAGCRGRLWLRGPQLRGGWLDTGLEGQLDDAGYLTVHDEAARTAWARAAWS